LYGTVCNIIPLQDIQTELDKDEKNILHVISHTTTQQALLQFDDQGQLESVNQELHNAKTRFRNNKMNQIISMLHDSVQ